SEASRADAFDRWVADLERRHLAELTFPEVARALRALSATYVERRQKIGEGAALSGAGKRAAFALFYGPLHFLLIGQIVPQLPGAARAVATVVDLGCATGASGAAWAAECDRRPRVVAVERSQWALDEAALTYRAFDLHATLRRGDLSTSRWPGSRAGILAAFTVNELPDAAREALLAQ